jgi:hypothetical protein
MARRTHDYRLKRAISIRLQLIIEERFESLYGFSQAMEAQGKTALASTVRGWLPPQKLWKAKPNGRAVRRVDWESVKVPDGATLIEFCEILCVRTDYILLGDGVASRSQTRAHSALELDVAAHVAESLGARGFLRWSSREVDGAAILTAIAEAAMKEADFYSRMIETAPARIAARGGMLLDLIGEIAQFLPDEPKAIEPFLTLTNTAALLEASFQSDFDFSKLETRYLSFPQFDPDDLPLPDEAISERINEAIQRREDAPEERLELTPEDELRLRRMLSALR